MRAVLSVLFLAICSVGSGLYCKDPDTGELHAPNTSWQSTTFCGNYSCVARSEQPRRETNFLKTEFDDNDPDNRFLNDEEIAAINAILQKIKKSEVNKIIQLYNMAMESSKYESSNTYTTTCACDSKAAAVDNTETIDEPVEEMDRARDIVYDTDFVDNEPKKFTKVSPLPPDLERKIVWNQKSFSPYVKMTTTQEYLTEPIEYFPRLPERENSVNPVRPNWKTDPLPPDLLEDVRSHEKPKHSALLGRMLSLKRIGRVETNRKKRQVSWSDIANNVYVKTITCPFDTEPGFFKTGDMTLPFPGCCPQKILDKYR